MNDVMHDEARHKTRLILYPLLATASEVSAGQAVVVASVEAFGESWVTLSQDSSGRVRRGIFRWEDVTVLAREEGEWALLRLLGVERVGGNLECWPACPARPAHMRGQFVVPREVALNQGLRVQWA